MKIAKVKISEILNHPTMNMDAKYWINAKAKKRKIKVRFNLSRGENYMKWKVEYPNKINDAKKNIVQYYSPDEVQLVMRNCILKNNRKVSEKIFNGENKSVCAWIMCEEISFFHNWLPEPDDNFAEHLFPNPKKLKYNPRKNPFWTNAKNENLDNTEHKKIYSIKSKLFF